MNYIRLIYKCIKLMFPLKNWFEADRSKHDSNWFNDLTRFIRWQMKPLISSDEAAMGMDYMLGRQDMSYVTNLFLNPTNLNIDNKAQPGALSNRFGEAIRPHENHQEFLQAEMQGIGFRPLPLMEKLRNIIVSEQKKMGIVVNVRAEDPTSTEDRRNDKALVKHHHKIQNFLSYIYTSIGQTPVSMDNVQSRFGEKPDAGNTQDFHAMGLNPMDPSDVDFFFKHFHKLDQEIAAQDPIDYFMSYNQVLDKMENWANDCIAKKALAAKVYVSEVNGAVTYEYVAPESIFIYGGGRRKDFNDANAKVYEQKCTVRQMIDIIGNSFDIEKEWDRLLVAISFTNGVEFTDIKTSYRGCCSAGNNESFEFRSNGVSYGYNQFMDFKVTLGYIECNSQVENYKADTEKEKTAFHQNNQPKEKYQSQARYETPMYKAYYLAVSAVDQILFDFGLMPYQDIEGYNDWCSNFSIITWKEIGDPISIVCKPFLDLINEAWYKFKYEIRRAKPRGTDYNYDSLVTIAMDMIPDTNVTKENKINKVIQMFDRSPNNVWTFPMIDGKPVMLTNNQLNIDKPNGLTPQALDWWKIVLDTWDKMMDFVGIAPLRQGDPGGPRDSMNNQFKALEYSEASTYYIPDMLTYCIQQLAQKTTFYVQDIITYKTVDTMAYRFLVDAVGQETLDKLETLGKNALHRFGIFIESLNQTALRTKLEAVLVEAVKNKSITTGEYLLMQDIKSPKKAFEIFAYFEQRNKRLAQKAIMDQQKQQQDAAMSLEQMRQKTETIKGSYSVQVAQIQANAQIQNHLINQKGGLDKQILKQNGDIELVYHQAAAEIATEQKTLNDTGKTTPPSAPPPPQSNALAASPGQPPSSAQQLRANAEPQSSENMPLGQ